MLSISNYYVSNGGNLKHNYLYNYRFTIALHAPSSFAYVIFLLHLSDLSFPMLDVISYENQFLSHYCLFKSDYLHHANLLSSLEPDS
jgi:hypothetical protein